MTAGGGQDPVRRVGDRRAVGVRDGSAVRGTGPSRGAARFRYGFRLVLASAIIVASTCLQGVSSAITGVYADESGMSTRRSTATTRFGSSVALLRFVRYLGVIALRIDGRSTRGLTT